MDSNYQAFNCYLLLGDVVNSRAWAQQLELLHSHMFRALERANHHVPTAAGLQSILGDGVIGAYSDFASAYRASRVFSTSFVGFDSSLDMRWGIGVGVAIVTDRDSWLHFDGSALWAAQDAIALVHDQMIKDNTSHQRYRIELNTHSNGGVAVDSIGLDRLPTQKMIDNLNYFLNQ